MIWLLIIKLLRPPPLLRVLLRDVVEVLAAGDVEVVVVAGRLAVHRHRHVVPLQPRQLEGLGVSLAAGKIISNSKKNNRGDLAVGDAAVPGLGLDAGGVVQVVEVPGVQRRAARGLRPVPAGLVVTHLQPIRGEHGGYCALIGSG